ncbi:MAG: acyl-CoA thioesterase [Flavobacteriaceae bacterium]|jgi:acyl-CoA hydrolase
MKKNTLQLSFLAQTTDVNYRGTVHGGKVMKWIDEAGYALAAQHTGKYCVTKFVDDIEFKNPISIGDLVLVEASVLRLGITSIRIHVTVASESLIAGERKDNCACDIVFVALDEQGNKIAITT